MTRLALIAIGLFPVAIHALLFAAEITLGSPRRIVYPYSPVAVLRFISVLKAMVLLIPIVTGLLLVGSHKRRKRTVGLGLFAASYAALVAWTLVGNPLGWPEHQFNMVSPSQDGAFLSEARGIESVSHYLRSYPDLVHRDPDELRGYRVLSNTPGTTLLAYGVRKLNETAPDLFQRIEHAVVGDQANVDDPRREIAEGVCMVTAFTVLWGMSIVFAYGFARCWWEPMTALVIAVACVFTPSSLIFTPGKDPAQLSTTLATLFFWFRAWRTLPNADAAPSTPSQSFSAYSFQCLLLAFLAGAMLVVAVMVSLVHIWIAVIALVATLWNTGRSRDRHMILFTRCTIPAIVGASAVILMAYLWCGWNIPATAIATSGRYMELQHDVLISPFYYNLIGGGIFLLFVGPAVWMLAALAFVRPDRDERARLGPSVFVLTVVVMLNTYFFAQNAEVARLWVVFVPLLVWSLALIALKPGHPSPRRRQALIAILVCQVAGTMLQWSMMDARGTESRILTQRHFDD